MEQGRGGEWVLYLRLSKGRAGIGRQRTITTGWVTQEMGGTIIPGGEFKDTDSTAFQQLGEARPQRKDFDRMLALVASRPDLNIAALHADRLTRGDEDTASIMRVQARSAGIVGTPRGGLYDLRTALGQKRFRDDASDAIYEVAHMRERILDKKKEARDAGVWLGGPRPFGWDRIPRLDKDEEPPALRLSPAEADLIRSGTLAIISGASLRSVTRAWNASGITGSRGGTWANREVSDVLRRARNAGLAEHDIDGHGLQVIRSGEWPAIVSEAEWRACKTILEHPGRRLAFSTQPKHLLSGIAVCGVCGTPVVATATRGANRITRLVYADRPKTSKGHVARSVLHLDAYVSELVIAWVERYGRDALTPVAPDTALLTGQLQAVEAELESLQNAADAEAISTAQWLRRTRPLNEKAATLRQRINDAAAAKVPAYVFTDEDIRAGWEGAGIDAQRALIRALMTVTIMPAPRGCPPGYKKGTPGGYFRSEFIKIEWKRKGAGESAGSA